MREGIYLGPPPGRTPDVLRALAVVALVGVVVQGIWYTRERASLDELGNLAREATPASIPFDTSSAETAEILRELRAAVRIGVVDAMPPASVLRFVETVLPEGVVLTSLDLDLGRPAQLTLAAVAESAAAVSRLQRNVEGSPLAVATELLEERRLPAGRLAMRLKVELREAASR